MDRHRPSEQPREPAAEALTPAPDSHLYFQHDWSAIPGLCSALHFIAPGASSVSVSCL